MLDRTIILGGPGSGTTTFGQALATFLAQDHFDADNFTWKDPSNYNAGKTTAAERTKRLIHIDMKGKWVFSGSIGNAGNVLFESATFVIFLNCDTSVRIKRLIRREIGRFREKLISDDAYRNRFIDFIGMAAAYETGIYRERKNRVKHYSLIKLSSKPYIILDANADIENMLSDLAHLIRKA